MDFHLTAEHEKIREASRRLAADFATRATQHDRETSLPIENYAALKREGFYGLTVPKELGGWGTGFLGWTIAAEELAQGCPSTALTFNMHVAAVETIMDDPQVPPRVKQRTADLVVKEQKLLAYSITEPGASSLAIGPSYASSVQARQVPGGYVLRGRKSFLSMVEGCDYIELLAHPAEETNPLVGVMFLVPYPAPGQRVEEVWDTLGMRGTRSKTREQIQDEMVRLKSRITVSGGGGGGFGGFRRGGGAPVITGVADASASIETDSENLVGALRLAVEMLREPAFSQEDLDQARQQRIAAIESSRSEPQTLAALEFQRHLSPYPRGDVRYSGTLAEQIDEMKKVTLEDDFDISTQ